MKSSLLDYVRGGIRAIILFTHIKIYVTLMTYTEASPLTSSHDPVKLLNASGSTCFTLKLKSY